VALTAVALTAVALTAVAPLPTIVGQPGSAWMTLPSCTLLPLPISMRSSSARNTQLNHRLAPAPSCTDPITCAPGAM